MSFARKWNLLKFIRFSLQFLEKGLPLANVQTGRWVINGKTLTSCYKIDNEPVEQTPFGRFVNISEKLYLGKKTSSMSSVRTIGPNRANVGGNFHLSYELDDSSRPCRQHFLLVSAVQVCRNSIFIPKFRIASHLINYVWNLCGLSKNSCQHIFLLEVLRIRKDSTSLSECSKNLQINISWDAGVDKVG